MSAVGGLQMSVNLYFIEDYENETTFRPKKTNPNKPKQTQFPKGQNELKIACRKIWPHPPSMLAFNDMQKTGEYNNKHKNTGKYLTFL